MPEDEFEITQVFDYELPVRPHLIAGRLEDHSRLLGSLTARSHDFH